MGSLIYVVVLIVIFAIPMVLSNRARKRQMTNIQEMQKKMHPGQRVVTTAGIHGRIVAVHNETIALEVATNVVITVERMGILRVIEPANETSPDTSTSPVDDYEALDTVAASTRSAHEEENEEEKAVLPPEQEQVGFHFGTYDEPTPTTDTPDEETKS